MAEKDFLNIKKGKGIVLKKLQELTDEASIGAAKYGSTAQDVVRSVGAGVQTAADMFMPDSAVEAGMGMVPVGKVANAVKTGLVKSTSTGLRKAVEEAAEAAAKRGGAAVDDVIDKAQWARMNQIVQEQFPGNAAKQKEALELLYKTTVDKKNVPKVLGSSVSEAENIVVPFSGFRKVDVAPINTSTKKRLKRLQDE